MANQDNKIQITAIIAGRPYSIKVAIEDEPVVIRLVKGINEKIKQFQNTYSGRDKQDLLAMTLLTYAVDLQKARTKSNTSQPANQISESLREIENLLDQLIDD